jgi:hypothetical protein
MAIETLTELPDEFYAGDTVIVSSSGGDFPAPTWTRTLTFQGPTPFTVDAAADGEDHLFTIASATTTAVEGGVYGWTEIAESDGQRATVDTGTVWIKPDPTVSVTSWARTCLTLLRAHIQGRLPAGLTSHTINGSSISKMSIPEAMKLESAFAARVAAEDAAKLTEGNDGNVVRIYFDR